MASSLEGVVTLPMLVVSGSVGAVAITATGATTLPMLTTIGTAQRSARTIYGASILPMLGVSGHIGEANRLRGAVRLKGLRSSGHIRWRAKIYNLTGLIRANGNAIFCFVGPPDRAVEWSIVGGSGALFPDLEWTDQWGRATCRYEAGGYTGMLTIRVSYGA